jgi:hypothetical protein
MYPCCTSQRKHQPTAASIVAYMHASFGATDVTKSEITAVLEGGADKGWLVPEDGGVYHLKEPVQTPDRLHTALVPVHSPSCVQEEGTGEEGEHAHTGKGEDAE